MTFGKRPFGKGNSVPNAPQPETAQLQSTQHRAGRLVQTRPSPTLRSEIETLWSREGAATVEHSFFGLADNLLEWVAMNDPLTASGSKRVDQSAAVAWAWIDREGFSGHSTIDGRQLAAAVAAHKQFSTLATRHIHQETLLAVLGALAGCAVAQIVWQRAKQNPEQRAAIQAYQKRPGATRYFDSALLDGWIVPIANGERFHLWDQFVTGAREAGFVAADSPLAIPMMQSVIQAIQADRFGQLSVPSRHQPRISIQNAVERLWYGYNNYLAAVSPDSRPTLTAMVARHFMAQMKDVLDPRVALTIVTESALFMSKIDPAALNLDVGKRLLDKAKSTAVVFSERVVH